MRRGGMPVPPRRLEDLIEGTWTTTPRWPSRDLQEVTIRWRVSFGYLIAWAGESDDDAEHIPLCRIECLGDDEGWASRSRPGYRDLRPGDAPHRAAHRTLQRRL
jgi:hypothetical protein